jgi:hypothetical protein
LAPINFNFVASSNSLINKIKVMALFKATVKRTATVNGIHVEKGMSVEIASKYTSNPIGVNGGHEVVDAFMRKYGIDIRKANMVSSSCIDVVKIG